MQRLVAVGACYIDTILTVPHFPGEDEKLRASTVTVRRGGNCPNTLEVLQQFASSNHRLERDCIELNLVSVLPSSRSAASTFIKDSLSGPINLSHCIHREDKHEAASSYIVKSLASDSRTIVNYNELPEMTSAEFEEITREIDDGKPTWYHFEGRIPDVTLECMKHLNDNASCKISVEVEKPGRAGLHELSEQAHVVFYSKTWAQHKAYQSPKDCLTTQAKLLPNVELLCCTWGEAGAAALDTRSNTYVHRPAYGASHEEEIRVVDPVGAGDTFIAGMLYALMCRSSDWRLEQKVDFANGLAGRKITQEGFHGLRRMLAD